MEPKMQSCYYSQDGYYLFIYTVYMYVCVCVNLLEKAGDCHFSLCVGAQVVPPLAVCLFPPLCDVSWGLSCCNEAALITSSRRVCGSRSVIIEQPGGRAEITRHISSTMRLPGLKPRPSRCSNGCHICLNTGIKLGWRKRRNNAVTDGRREKKMEEEVTFVILSPLWTWRNGKFSTSNPSGFCSQNFLS